MKFTEISSRSGDFKISGSDVFFEKKHYVNIRSATENLQIISTDQKFCNS